MKPAPLFRLAPALLILACCSVSVPATAQDRPLSQLRTLSRDELDVIKILTNQERAWNAGDLTAFTGAFKDSPETLIVGNQLTRGFQTLVSDYRHNYPNKESMGTLAFSELEPHVLDEHYAVVVGKYHLERPKKMGGTVEGLFSLVLEKTDKGWKIVVDHTT
jgi:ketosteroid isomerase-like protein